MSIHRFNLDEDQHVVVVVLICNQEHVMDTKDGEALELSLLLSQL